MSVIGSASDPDILAVLPLDGTIDVTSQNTSTDISVGDLHVGSRYTPSSDPRHLTTNCGELLVLDQYLDATGVTVLAEALRNAWKD